MIQGLQCITILFMSLWISTTKEDITKEDINTISVNAEISESEQIYQEFDLKNTLDFSIFEKAYTGYKKLNTKKKDILTIIDFSSPSSKKRMYILDMANRKVLFESYVSHGRNSGELYATSFSNQSGSHKSSLGFYETQNTYMGANGYSLILNGLEKGINDQAKPRAIVIHGADYCTPETIASSGRLGRSFGCPSIPPELTEPIINTIKDGSLLYIYADNDNYFQRTKIL